jgi:hypothetical protein
MSTHVTLPADVNRIDETGYIGAFLDRSRVPDAVRPGAVVVAGDDDDPVVAEVIDIVEGPAGRKIVHLDVLGPAEVFAEALATAGVERR